jgi:hypothetical protein
MKPHNLDVVLVQDVSASMTNPVQAGATLTRLLASQIAAETFVNFLPETDRVAVVSYSTFARLAQPLTTAKGSVTQTIYGLTLDAWTNIGEGINVSHQELISSPRYLSETVKAIILLTDGQANRPVDEPTAAQYARERATAAANSGIKIYTIGFGDDVDQSLLIDLAEIGNGEYFFAPDQDTLETIYLTIALQLRSLLITDILTPDVAIDCSYWSTGQCLVGSSGVTTLTLPINDTLLVTGSAQVCITAVANLDPNYEGLVNLPGSGISYRDSEGNLIDEPFDNPAISVGGRKIEGYVYYDVNGNRTQDPEEQGVPNVMIQAAATASGTVMTSFVGMTTTTDMSGYYVLRTSSGFGLSVTMAVPPGYVGTSPVSNNIPVTTGIYTTNFGIRWMLYLPVTVKKYPPPSIINGGFEQGWSGWAHGGELVQSIVGDNPYSGVWVARLGNPNYVCQNGVPIGSAWMEQVFQVPDTANPHLEFKYNIFTQDINPYLSDNFDSFDVKINGEVRFRDAKITGSYGCAPQVETNLGWMTGTISLNTDRGRYIIIRFENRNPSDNWYNTWTFVDDVQFIP